MPPQYKPLIHVALPLLAGIAIYALWRGLHVIDPYQAIFPLYAPGGIPGWVRYNLPDGLWLYALLWTLALAWGAPAAGCRVWMMAAAAASLLTEALQAARWISGTFDIADVLAYLAAIIIFNMQYPVIQFNISKTIINNQKKPVHK